MNSTILPGDIFLTTGFDPVSWGISAAIRGWATHSAWVEDWPVIISADVDGVNRRKVHKSELDRYAVLRSLIPIQPHLEAMQQFAGSCVGQGFDYLGMILFGIEGTADDYKWWCSELVAEIYHKAEVNLFPPRVKATEISPMDLWKCWRLDTVMRVGI